MVDSDYTFAGRSCPVPKNKKKRHSHIYNTSMGTRLVHDRLEFLLVRSCAGSCMVRNEEKDGHEMCIVSFTGEGVVALGFHCTKSWMPAKGTGLVQPREMI